jgi:hypothetical protein
LLLKRHRQFFSSYYSSSLLWILVKHTLKNNMQVWCNVDTNNDAPIIFFQKIHWNMMLIMIININCNIINSRNLHNESEKWIRPTTWKEERLCKIYNFYKVEYEKLFFLFNILDFILKILVILFLFIMC